MALLAMPPPFPFLYLVYAFDAIFPPTFVDAGHGHDHLDAARLEVEGVLELGQFLQLRVVVEVEQRHRVHLTKPTTTATSCIHLVRREAQWLRREEQLYVL